MKDYVRFAAVGWVGALCFIFAYFVSGALDRLTPELNDKKPKWQTFLEVVLQFSIVGIIVYMARSIIIKVPFPLNHVSGFQYKEMAELRSLPLMVFIFMFFQKKTQDKMRFIM